jgi:hypothetical protein
VSTVRNGLELDGADTQPMPEETRAKKSERAGDEPLGAPELTENQKLTTDN